MKCKQIDLGKAFCSESALDGVSKLVAKGFKVTEACNIVAKQYSENYPDEAPKSAKQLRKKFYDAQNPNKPKKTKAKKSLEDNTTICKSCAEKDIIIAELRTQISYYADIFEKQALNELTNTDPHQVPDEKTDKSLNSFGLAKGKVPREILFLCIEKSGNDFQRHAIKSSNLTNKQLLNMAKAVINVKNSKVPPTQEDVDILEADEVV